MQDDDGNKGAITLSTFVVLDGSSTPTKINISGLYPTFVLNPYGRYVFIDIPRFTTSAEYFFNIYIPSSSGDESSFGTEESSGAEGTAGSYFSKHEFWFIIGFCIGGTVLCCCSGIAIYVKMRGG